MTLSEEWPPTPLGQLLTQVQRPERIADLASVPYAGVRWYAEGVYARDSVDPSLVKAVRLNRLHLGDITYNRMWATKAAFGVVGSEAAGCLVTNDFPIFEARDGLDAGYLALVFASRPFQEVAATLAVGTTERKRLKEKDFLSIRISLPPLPAQRVR